MVRTDDAFSAGDVIVTWDPRIFGTASGAAAAKALPGGANSIAAWLIASSSGPKSTTGNSGYSAPTFTIGTPSSTSELSPALVMSWLAPTQTPTSSPNMTSGGTIAVAFASVV